MSNIIFICKKCRFKGAFEDFLNGDIYYDLLNNFLNKFKVFCKLNLTRPITRHS